MIEKILEKLEIDYVLQKILTRDYDFINSNFQKIIRFYKKTYVIKNEIMKLFMIETNLENKRILENIITNNN